MAQNTLLGDEPITASIVASNPEEKSSQPSQARWEPILVVVTLVAILTSALAARLELPSTLILVLNVISYVAGGWFGVQKSIESLRKGEINVDLLMVLAALGAATVNQWREGAILLFLFSLRNVLQNYAMDRSRNAIL